MVMAFSLACAETIRLQMMDRDLSVARLYRPPPLFNNRR